MLIAVRATHRENILAVSACCILDLSDSMQVLINDKGSFSSPIGENTPHSSDRLYFRFHTFYPDSHLFPIIPTFLRHRLKFSTSYC